VTVYMDVHGIKAEDLDIQLENDMLTVRGERRPPWESLEGCTARVERSFGAFERTLRVTDGLDPEGIEASMSDGVLMMRLPEPAQTQPRRIHPPEHGDRQRRGHAGRGGRRSRGFRAATDGAAGAAA
jgi:HSP20 family protein